MQNGHGANRGGTPSLPRAPGWTHHSLCRGQLLLAGLGRFALGAHPVDEDRDGDIDGAVSTAQEAYDEGAGKAMQTLAAQDVKDDHDEPGRQRRQDRPAQGLVDGVVDQLIGQVWRLSLDLADPVEDHDRVVDREADQGQERRHYRQVDFELIDHQQAADDRDPDQPVADGDRAQGDQDVVDHGEHGRQPVDERMESPPEVDDDDHPAGHGGDQGEGSRLAGHGAAEDRDPLEEKVAVAG